jgi:hypothetical protein
MSSVTVFFCGGKKFFKSCHHVTRHKSLTCLLWRTFCFTVYYFNNIINLSYTILHYSGLIWNRSYLIPDFLYGLSQELPRLYHSLVCLILG